jgi:prepilin-type processing-associated H-X9-DG protein
MKTIGNGLQTKSQEKASFLSENILPMQESNILYKDPRVTFRNQNRFGIFFADGHTEKQMIPHIQYKDKTIVFCADLLATAGHIR